MARVRVGQEMGHTSHLTHPAETSHPAHPAQPVNPPQPAQLVLTLHDLSSAGPTCAYTARTPTKYAIVDKPIVPGDDTPPLCISCPASASPPALRNGLRIKQCLYVDVYEMSDQVSILTSVQRVRTRGGTHMQHSEQLTELIEPQRCSIA